MKRLAALLMVLILPGCAHLMGSKGETERASLWVQAQEEFWRGNFTAALEGFTYLNETWPESVEGRESIFYLGAIYLDPRNDDWDSKPAEEYFARYLAFISDEGPRIYRYPEAQTMHEIARQLNLPAESRVAALQPEERVVRVEERVVVPAAENRALTAELARLREELAATQAKNQQQREELERIRRTLTAPASR